MLIIYVSETYRQNYVNLLFLKMKYLKSLQKLSFEFSHFLIYKTILFGHAHTFSNHVKTVRFTFYS